MTQPHHCTIRKVHEPCSGTPVTNFRVMVQCKCHIVTEHKHQMSRDVISKLAVR